MAVWAGAGTLVGMNITTTNLPYAHPVETGWVDDALAQVQVTGDPAWTLVGRPMTGGPGILIVAGATGEYELVNEYPGPATGPAHYLQLITFDGPRSEAFAAAEERASVERLAPATRYIPGIVRHLRARSADRAVLVMVLAETVEAIDEGVRVAMSTPLLPGEDPTQLTEPDRIGLYRLMHADLPMNEGLQESERRAVPST